MSLKSNMNIELSVVIPCYNEEQNLQNAVSQATQVMSKMDIPYELIFVNDGSTDKTKEILEKYAKEHKILFVNKEKNEGWGSGVLEGFKHGSGKYFAFIPADEQVPFAAITRVYETICTKPPKTIVKIKRIERNKEFIRKICSTSYTALVNLFFTQLTQDYNGTPKILMRADFASILPTFKDNFFDTELLQKASAAGFTIIEVLESSNKRMQGRSSVKIIKEALVTLRDMYYFKRNGHAPKE
jgi:glycosyltransferase involved in cell wall biosynthesis